jgi:N-acetylmuramoyl-L-alanine amidase
MKLFKTINLSKLKIEKKEKTVCSIADFKNYNKKVKFKKQKNSNSILGRSGHYIIFSKRALVLLLVFIIALSCFAFIPSILAATPNGVLTIVIDAGHGGIDGGCVGTLEGSNERELNLKYANTLKKYFKEYGINVVMTRTTTDGLYSSFSQNRKKDDMEKRRQIIEKANADLIISIHMNSFPLKSVRGAHVFYNPESEVSKNLADSIQSSLYTSLSYAKKSAGSGDYYMLTCTNVPAVIIECGFLSNIEEEKLLLSDEYCEKTCYAILCGVIKYLG